MNEYIPVALVIALILFSYAYRRLMVAAQPLRLELAEKGEALVANPNLSRAQKLFVQAMMDTAFKNRAFLIIALFAIPVVALCLVIRPSTIESRIKAGYPNDPKLRAMIRDVSQLHDRITFYNHPVLMFLVEFELLLLMGLLYFTDPMGYIPSCGG